MEARAFGGGEWFIASSFTGRYLLETSDSGDIRSIRGNEGGWVGVNNKPVVTADANYYNLAQWRLVPIRAGQYRIQSSVTGRYLFETSHLNNKPVVTADEDYYNLACWKMNVRRSYKENGVRLANSFVRSGQIVDLPAIGLGIDSQIISGSGEGAADATSLAVHPGHKDSANTLLEIRFSPTGPVQFSGAVTELGVHCGGVDVWVYAGSEATRLDPTQGLVASTTALNTDAAWSFASSVATSGVIRVFVGPGEFHGCDHSQVSLTVSAAAPYQPGIPDEECMRENSDVCY